VGPIAERLCALETLRRPWAPDEIAAEDDRVRSNNIRLREHGVERGQIAVDVVQRRDG
jgi:hypothetical protein